MYEIELSVRLMWASFVFKHTQLYTYVRTYILYRASRAEAGAEAGAEAEAEAGAETGAKRALVIDPDDLGPLPRARDPARGVVWSRPRAAAVAARPPARPWKLSVGSRLYDPPGAPG